VPIAGIFVSGLALVLAVISALSGDRVFATATPLIAGVNTFFLSPSVWMAMAGSSASGEQTGFVVAIIVFLVAPFVAMILNATGNVVLNRP